MSEEWTKDRARTLLEEWTAGESLRKHGLALAICTEAYGAIEAALLGLTGAAAEAFAEPYACAGLLHDMDYERHPSLDEHPFVGVAYLREHGWPEEVLHAILAHADYSGTPRESHLDKALFACDELAGFLTACALVKPTKSIMDVEVKGVLKKMKDKAFARAVSREDMAEGAALLGISVEEHVRNCLGTMQARSGGVGAGWHMSSRSNAKALRFIFAVSMMVVMFVLIFLAIFVPLLIRDGYIAPHDGQGGMSGAFLGLPIAAVGALVAGPSWYVWSVKRRWFERNVGKAE